MKDDAEKEVSRHLIQGRPRLRFDPAFTAKVMAEVRETKVKLFIPWRKIAVVTLVVLVVAGAGTLGFKQLQNTTTIANGTSGAQNGSAGSQSSSAQSTPNYQELATNAQDDISSMSLHTGNLSDNDYADSQLADSAIF